MAQNLTQLSLPLKSTVLLDSIGFWDSFLNICTCLDNLKSLNLIMDDEGSLFSWENGICIMLERLSSIEDLTLTYMSNHRLMDRTIKHESLLSVIQRKIRTLKIWDNNIERVAREYVRLLKTSDTRISSIVLDLRHYRGDFNWVELCDVLTHNHTVKKFTIFAQHIDDVACRSLLNSMKNVVTKNKTFNYLALDGNSISFKKNICNSLCFLISHLKFFELKVCTVNARKESRILEFCYALRTSLSLRRFSFEKYYPFANFKCLGDFVWHFQGNTLITDGKISETRSNIEIQPFVKNKQRLDLAKRSALTLLLLARNGRNILGMDLSRLLASLIVKTYGQAEVWTLENL
jgi:hypothetical protein